MNDNGSFDSKSILDQVDRYLSDQGVRQGEGSTPHFQDLEFQMHPGTQRDSHQHQSLQQHPGSSLSLDLHDLDSLHKPQGLQLDLDVHAQTQGAAPASGQSASHSHVRPEMVFSPVISPMVGPQNPSHTPFLRTQGPGSGGGPRPAFSPLTSPSIDALENPSNSSRQQYPEYNGSKRGSSSSSSRGKKTPLSTPALTATTYSSSSSSKIAKNSPQLSSRRSALNKRKSVATNWDDMFKLPDSSIPPPPPPGSLFPGSQSHTHHSHSSTHTHLIQDPIDGSISGSASSVSSCRTHHSGTPAIPSSTSRDGENSDYNPTTTTNVNYPKVILPSNNRDSSGRAHSPVRDHNSHGNGHVIMATDSPVIQAKNPHLPVARHASGGSSLGGGAPRSTPELKPLRQGSKSSLNDSEVDPDDDQQQKKEVHKAAEQGRRDRLNNALAELHSLIPTEMKESVLIPSKATTIEMACAYIRQLAQQLERSQ